MGIEEQNLHILEKFVFDRNLALTTKMEYNTCIKKYTNLFDMGMEDLLAEAEAEEEAGIRWKNRTLKKRLMEFRIFLTKNYLSSTVISEVNRIKSVYRHFDIEIHKLPEMSTKSLQTSKPIIFMDLPNKNIIKEAMKIATPIMRAIIAFQVSSGCARNETLNLTISDFIEATSSATSLEHVLNAQEKFKDKAEDMADLKVMAVNYKSMSVVKDELLKINQDVQAAEDIKSYYALDNIDLLGTAITDGGSEIPAKNYVGFDPNNPPLTYLYSRTKGTTIAPLGPDGDIVDYYPLIEFMRKDIQDELPKYTKLYIQARVGFMMNKPNYCIKGTFRS